MAKDIDILLRGRWFKKVLEDAYEQYRKRFALKQIDIEILLFSFQHKGVSASDIYRTLHLNKGQVSKSMFGLCENGYLYAKQDKADRRYVFYEITEQGMKVVSELGITYNKIIENVFEGVTEEEKKVVCHVTETMLANVEKMGYPTRRL